jgi:hypothetical protein
MKYTAKSGEEFIAMEDGATHIWKHNKGSSELAILVTTESLFAFVDHYRPFEDPRTSTPAEHEAEYRRIETAMNEGRISPKDALARVSLLTLEHCGVRERKDHEKVLPVANTNLRVELSAEDVEHIRNGFGVGR